MRIIQQAFRKDNHQVEKPVLCYESALRAVPICKAAESVPVIFSRPPQAGGSVVADSLSMQPPPFYTSEVMCCVCPVPPGR